MSKLGDLYKAFVIGSIKNTEEEPNVDEWFEFLGGLSKPTDVFEESYNKYLCRMYYFKGGKTAILNIISFCVLIPLTIRMLFHNDHLPRIDKDLLLLEEQYDVSYIDVFPNELKAKYKEFKAIKREKGAIGKLGDDAKKLYLQAWMKYWGHPYYLMWIMKELSAHSNYIRKYNPKSLAFYINERNVASPILTKLYEDRGGKLISFMHGEYLLSLIQAYMHFSEFYIWDKSYVEMFKDDLRCGIGEYHLYTPLKMVKKWNLEDFKPKYYITYYFSAENSQTLKRLSDVFAILTNSGKACKVRPHPRVSHLEKIKELFYFLEIEDPTKVSIEQSLRETELVAGLNTTVLLEGLIEGRKIVIDDISNPEGYTNLKKRRSLTINRDHYLLSDIVSVYFQA